MTEEECVTLVAFLAARCPSMRVEQGTPRTWHLDLEPFDLDDAMQAARELSLDKPYVSLSELYKATETIRDRRVGRARIAALREADERETRALTAVAEPVDRDDLKRRLKVLNAKAKPLPRAVDPTNQARMAQARREVEEVRKRQQAAAEAPEPA